MKRVAKLVMIDGEGKYLLLYLNKHPVFGDGPDLPGGTAEDSETLIDAMAREVYEEAGVVVNKTSVEEVYSGLDYSEHGTHKALFVARVEQRPEINLSWEHSAYEWIERDEFLQKAQSAKDTYMHMVHDVLKPKVSG